MPPTYEWRVQIRNFIQLQVNSMSFCLSLPSTGRHKHLMVSLQSNLCFGDKYHISDHDFGFFSAFHVRRYVPWMFHYYNIPFLNIYFLDHILILLQLNISILKWPFQFLPVPLSVVGINIFRLYFYNMVITSSE